MPIIPSLPVAEIARQADTKEIAVSVGSILADQDTEKGNFLVVSPYDEKPHLLDLRTLDAANQLLAKALVGLECLRDDYATAPYVDIFNVSYEILPPDFLLGDCDSNKQFSGPKLLVPFESWLEPQRSRGRLLPSIL
jgi:hypothetical protein